MITELEEISTKVKPFVKTEKQIQACDVLNSFEHAMLFGGSRSGKTFIAVRNIIVRAIKYPSTHLLTRFRFSHAKASLWYGTIPKVKELCFPDVPFVFNKADWFIEIPTRIPGKTSQIWLGGIDDKERVEKILGNEYSTILVNEASQVSYDAVTTLRTRLAELTPLVNRMYYDLNPPGKKHWSYVEFIEKLIPKTKEKSLVDSGFLLMNPRDNLINLPETYLKTLMALPKRQRQRFLDGLFLSDVEGALWTDEMVSNAFTKPYGEIIKTVIAVDPATTNNPGSDECGIVCCELDENREGVIEGDYSGKMSTSTWAQKVVNLYHDKNANAVIVEVNQGGDLVEDVIKNSEGGRGIKIIKVHASKGKFARAEPVSALYEQKKISHKIVMQELESELTEWVPLESKSSPNRLDALVWGITHLMVRTSPMVHIG